MKTGARTTKPVRAKSLEELMEVKPLSPFMLPRQMLQGEKPSPYFPDTPPLKDEEIEFTGRIFRNFLSRVFRAAECGDPAAVELLIGSAFYTTEALELIARKFPEHLKKHSRRHLKWPGFIGKKAILSGHLKPSRAGKKGGNQPLNAWLVERLELSKECPLRSNWQPQSAATQTAFFMLEWLCINATPLRLPPLNSKNRDLWFEKGWGALSEATGGKPECDPYLRDIAENQGREKSMRQAIKTPKSIEGNIRDRLKSSLKQSFKTLTQHFH